MSESLDSGWRFGLRMRIRSFLDVQILIYPASKVQPNHRVYRPCMITLREGTIFDAFAPGNVA